MNLFLSRLHFPVTTLGFGRRVGVWFQGCSIHCPGCLSQDTWEFGRGQTTVESVCTAIAENLPQADGVTISGGEPFDQPAAIEELLRWLRGQFVGDILLYSGYPWEQLTSRLGQWQDLVDVIISDPYVPGAGHTLALRGSDNQRVHLLTPLARERYAGLATAHRDHSARALDLIIDGDRVWMAGIPGPGDLERLRQKLLEAGFAADTSEAPRVLA